MSWAAIECALPPVGLLLRRTGEQMQTITAPAAAASAATRSAVRGRVRSRFYVGLSVFMVAIMVVGFWPSYFGPMLRGNIERPAVIQVHGIIFVGWMALLMAQVMFAARGRIDLHRRIGRYGIAYGWLVVAIGLIVGPAAAVMHIRAGEWTRDQGAGFLLTTFGDMVLFGSCFGAAVAYRARPEIHKRLMIAATVALLFAAVGRMRFIESRPLLALLWLSPLLVGMGHDWITRRRIHLAYVVATLALFVGAFRILFEQSEFWLRIGRPIIDAIL
jgi:hypothetical protein